MSIGDLGYISLMRSSENTKHIWKRLFLQSKHSFGIINLAKSFLNCIADTMNSNYDSKLHVGLKSLLREVLSKPEVYGDSKYKMKKTVGSYNFSAHLLKQFLIIKRMAIYNLNVLQQTACLVVNPITFGNFAFLFYCTPVGRTSDSMTVRT